MPPTIRCCCGDVFTKLLTSSDKGIQRHPQTQASNKSSIVAYICCLRNMFVELLPTNERRDYNLLSLLLARIGRMLIERHMLMEEL
jgi:hypothetical protein